MTTQEKTPIRALIEAVEAGTARMDDFARALPSESAYGKCRWHDAHNSYNGSLDAANWLHDDLVPDWSVESFHLHGEVVLKRNRPLDRTYGYAGMDTARAWLLAILRAYEEQQ